LTAAPSAIRYFDADPIADAPACWEPWLTAQLAEVRVQKSIEGAASALLSFAERPKRRALIEPLVTDLLAWLSLGDDAKPRTEVSPEVESIAMAALLRAAPYAAKPLAPFSLASIAQRLLMLAKKSPAGTYSWGATPTTRCALTALSTLEQGNGSVEVEVRAEGAVYTLTPKKGAKQSVVVPSSKAPIRIVMKRGNGLVALEATATRPWSNKPEDASQLALTVQWPNECKRSQSCALTLNVSNVGINSRKVEILQALPPGFQVTRPQADMIVSNGTLRIRKVLAAGGNESISVPLVTEMPGEYQTMEAVATEAGDEVARAPSQAVVVTE
jgi:hypothetical protein